MRRRATVMLLGVLLIVTGCATAPSAADETVTASAQVPLSDVVPLADPRAWTGESTAVIDEAEIVPVVESPSQELPAEVVSHDLGGDTDVVVSDTSRVVAMDLSGSLAATVWGLGFGETLVGRDVSTTFPGAVDLPVITTDGHSANAEAVIALAPTLVLTDGSIGPRDVVEQLRDVGITVVFVEESWPIGSTPSSPRCPPRSHVSRRPIRMNGCAWCSSTCGARPGSTTCSAKNPGPTP